MTGVQTLEARLVLGGAAALAGVTLPSLSCIHRPTSVAFRNLLSSTFLFSRLAIFVLVFLVLKIAPRGDVPGFYFAEASAVLHGALPYRDFGSSYAPLHSFVDGAALLAWNSPLALILFAIITESLLVYVWLRFGEKLFSKRELRVASVLYLTSAISLQFVALDGQDNVLVALLVLISLWMAMRSEVLLSGMLTALAAVMVKLIPIFYAPAFFVGLRRRWSWALGFLAIASAGYGGFAALHLPVLQPLAIEGPLKSSGTLPFLIEAVTGLDLSVRFWDAIMLLILCGTYAAVWRAARAISGPSRVGPILWGVATSTMVLVTFANKSWSPYLVLILFPLCILVSKLGFRARVMYALFGIVALVEKSYWATLLSQEGAPELHLGLLHRNGSSILFLFIQICLLLGYGWLLMGCARMLMHPLSGDARNKPVSKP